MRCCAGAVGRGVRVGLALAEARSLVPEAEVQAFDAAESARALRLLALWCSRFSPTVGIDPTPTQMLPAAIAEGPVRDGLLLDITGAAHLFGGEHLMVTEIHQRLRRLGVANRVALADTVGAAWALARYGEGVMTIVPGEEARSQKPEARRREPNGLFEQAEAGRLYEVIERLPIEALRLDEQTCGQLRLVGIEAVGELMKLPRGQVAARYGAIALLRMDQMMGRVVELIEPVRPEAQFVAARALGEAGNGGSGLMDWDAVAAHTRETLLDLCAQLEKQERGVRTLQLTLKRADATPVVRTLALARASRQIKHLFTLLQIQLQGLRPRGNEAQHLALAETQLTFSIEEVRLEALWTTRLPHRQQEAFAAATDEEDFEALLDTLSARLGAERVLGAAPVDGYLPEDENSKRKTQNSKRGEKAEVGALSVWPAQVFDVPEEIEAVALLPDSPPHTVRWRGESFVVQAASGAVRIGERWWEDKMRNAKCGMRNAESSAGTEARRHRGTKGRCKRGASPFCSGLFSGATAEWIVAAGVSTE